MIRKAVALEGVTLTSVAVWSGDIHYRWPLPGAALWRGVEEQMRLSWGYSIVLGDWISLGSKWSKNALLSQHICLPRAAADT